MAAMDELETLLQSLQALKPPGITKTKIDAITSTCVDNVQSEAIIVDKIVRQYHSSPATHKLGIFYVIDSVSRQWLERARKTGQAVSKNAAPGTFASGVQKITDVLSVLMTDLIRVAPDNQKEKISKLLDIWERGQTFPHSLLAGFKQQLNNPPTGSSAPASDAHAGFSAPSAHTGSANLQVVAPTAPPPATQDAAALLAILASVGQPPAPVNAMPAAPPALTYPQPAVPPPPPGFMPPLAVPNPQPTPPAAASGVNALVTPILQALQAGQVSPEQAFQLINMINAQQNGGLPVPPPQPPVATQAQAVQQNAAQQERFEQSNDRYRNRSRSPDMNHRRHSPARRTPPNRRDSPTYGVYDPNANADGAGGQHDYGRGRARGRSGRNDRNEFRQRSPPRRQPSPAGNGFRSNAPKFIDWDDNLPRDHIKVLSRTLFIGGASGTEGEIRNIFSRFGNVQTCIVNQEKRHAFVKMLTRPEAVAAKEGMDAGQDPSALSKARQTRWGVGFGPRDCSDYNTGISVIPISRLTDADRKWVVTAENGGTGGRPLEGGMVIEEPDIEIGAGVSSKAISRRVPPDVGRGGRGSYGSRGDRGGRGGFDGGRFPRQDRHQQQEQRHISPRAEPAVAVPPAVPGFGFNLPGMNL